MATPPRVCSRCLYDKTIRSIVFDANGVCQFCKIHDTMEKRYPLGEAGERRLEELVARIKASGRGKSYDCVVGVSGGVDSTYTLFKAVSLGLRPLAVHFDNGWDSEIAVHNIENATRRLGVELYTHVVDWDDFRRLQISFLKASTSDAEIPTDMAISAVLLQSAARDGLRYVLSGHSFRTEGIVPRDWTYFDGRYIRSVHKRFSGSARTNVPNLSLLALAWYMFGRRIHILPFLNYMEYDKKEAAAVLAREIDWQDYGGHHHESLYTHFFQSYLLPRKFGIDKRKLGLSARVRSGKISRDEALATIQAEPYPEKPELVEYTIRKLELTQAEFDAIMDAPVKTFQDYPTTYPLLRALRGPLALGTRLGVVPPVLYYKYVYAPGDDQGACPQ
ncbi:N-acetyl sugar amidotransferase [Solidesulfovibrio fructosivorans JJ]]|uniref:N-acetyl sugar amidotransferase n=1 Tax=Solidesulfovibrio fructosivorans JJ] TaxID=596151 RepID=E1JXR7_SOLFR|nr:N-acetyl sugar amidotransferase [Solidesulfovibrio fructosivorans]EFL50840.1 N-acetyl sugar amidotransferase [Solidesulfovibrio fructosivorans JJ]]